MENMLVSLSAGLSQIGARPIIAVFEDARDPHTEIAGAAQSLGLTVEKIRCSGRIDTRAIKALRNLISTYEIDVVHSHGYKADIYASIAEWRRPPVLVATSHNWPSRLWHMRLYAAIDRLLLRRFDTVAVVSDLVAQKLERSGVRRDSIRTVPNGVEISRFRNAAPTLKDDISANGGLLVGCIGRAIPGKGGREFLQSAQLVLQQFPATSFVWIGDGPSLVVWKQLAIDLGIAESVYFPGVRTDMPGVYASLDVVALPSLEEAMPVCLLEAMAAGRAVIASDVGAVKHVIEQEITGILIPPGDVTALAAAMIRLIKDSPLREALGSAGALRTKEKFSIDNTARRYFSIYEAACARRATAHGAGVLEKMSL